jgi:hypothetical protein
MTEKCFLCGRTERDLDFVHEDGLSRFDVELEQLRGALQRAEAKANEEHGRAVELLDSVDAKYMSFSLRTLKGDLQAFRAHIPAVQDLVTECERLPGAREQNTLSELRELANPASMPQVKSAKKALDGFVARREQYLSTHGHFYAFPLSPSELRDCEVHPPSRKNQPPTTFYVCVVCHALITKVCTPLAEHFAQQYQS